MTLRGVSKLIPASVACLSLGLLLAGCGRDEIKVYRVSKEEPKAPAPAAPQSDNNAMPPGHPPISGMPSAARANVSWTLPDGWEEINPGRMSRGTFMITNDAGLQAQVSITPLPGLEGKEVPIVNMWRQQVGLSELSDDDAAKELKPVEIGGQPGRMFNVTGKSDTGSSMRIVTAIVSREGVSWFYKLIGDDALVEAQKPRFVSFLNSIRITDEPVAEAAPPDMSGGLPQMGGGPAESTPGETAAGFHWTVPSGWKVEAAGQMQLAKFSVPAVGDAKAEVMVSAFPNSTGGVPGNVNRWRRQIGLPPLDDAEAAALAQPLDDKLPDAVLVDMTGGDKQLIGAILPRNGQWWFYKLIGDPGAVAPQKDAFVAFVKSEP